MADLKAQLELTADSKGVEVGVGKAKKSLSDLGVTAERTSERAARSVDNYIRRLDQQTKSLGKSGREAKLLELTQRGASEAQLRMADSLLRMNERYTAHEQLLGRARIATAAFVASIATGSVAALRSTIDLLDKLDEMSEKTGISAESLSALRYAAEVAGTPMEALATGIRKLSVNMANAASGNKEALSTFQALSVEIRNTDGTLRTSEQIIGDLANRFAGYEDGVEKSAIAQRVFGKSGEDMIPVLNQGAAGIARLRTEAQRLGVVYSSDVAKAAADFNDNMTRVKLGAEGAAVSLTGGIIKAMAELSTEFIEARRNGSLLEAWMQNYWSWTRRMWGAAPKVPTTQEIQARVDALGGPSAGGGRGFVNPKVAAPVVPDEVKDKKTGTKADPYAESRRYLEGLQRQLDRTKELSLAEMSLREIQTGRLGKVAAETQKAILAVAQQIDVAKQEKEAQEAATRAREQAVQMQERADDQALATVAQMIEHNQILREEIELIGLEAPARLAVEQARLSSAMAFKEEELAMLQNAGASVTMIQSLEREIELLRQRSGLLGQKHERAVVAEEAEASKQWAKDLNTDLKQAFFDAFQSTKNPLKAFGDSIFATVNARMSAALAESLATNILDGLDFGAKGGGGGFLGDVFGSLLGKRAIGGPVSAGGLYRVNERGPELLDVAGQQFLMMGNQGGQVTPAEEGRGRSQTNNITVNVPQGATRATGNQIAAQIARQLRIADARMN